jgi:hypothetical protein
VLEYIFSVLPVRFHVGYESLCEVSFHAWKGLTLIETFADPSTVRSNRPPWSTGLFVALACTIAAVGGVVGFVEGKAVKKVEGVAQTKEIQNGEELRPMNTNATGHESVHLNDKKDRGGA